MLYHILHALGGVDEVRVEGDGAVSLRPIGPLEREAQQLFETARVSPALAVRHDRHGQHLAYDASTSWGVVRRGVVQDQQLVFPRERREHLTYLPQHEARRAASLCTGTQT